MVITKNIYNIANDYTYSFSTEAVNSAVFQSLNNGIKYSDVVYVEKDKDGDIALISANSVKINEISREIASLTEQILEFKLKNGIPIPLLAFSGIDFLSGYGEIVYFNSVAISSVLCDFVSEFKSAGLNQTLHSIYLTVNVNVNLNFPLKKYISECVSKVLILENVLIGKVPEIYLNNKLFQ